MKEHSIVMSKGKEFKVPMYDVLIADHFAKDSSYINTLLDEVNTRHIYAPLFKGRNELTFLDIGANIGLVSIYASQSCKRIVAVEPDPSTFNILHSMTHNLPMIECFQAALAPTIGEVDFYQNDLNTTASSTVNTYGTLTKVRGVTLMEIIRIHQLDHVDVCKCDAEGAEHDALTYEQLSEAKPVIKEYWIECHNTPYSVWEDTIGRLVTDFSKLGYYSQSIDGMRLRAWQS